ncbi:MAG: hypothetical protein AAF366_08830 [Pseudomonadota bacterium]
MLKVTLASDEFDDETLTEVQYALFGDLNRIDEVDVVNASAPAAAGERGAVGAIGVVLKAVAPGAVTSVVEAFATRFANEPEIVLDFNGLKLSTRNLGADEFKSILAEVLKNNE